MKDQQICRVFGNDGNVQHGLLSHRLPNIRDVLCLSENLMEGQRFFYSNCDQKKGGCRVCANVRYVELTV